MANAADAIQSRYATTTGTSPSPNEPVHGPAPAMLTFRYQTGLRFSYAYNLLCELTIDAEERQLDILFPTATISLVGERLGLLYDQIVRYELAEIREAAAPVAGHAFVQAIGITRAQNR